MDWGAFFFWLLAAGVVIGALGVVIMRQPVHSALFLLLSFLSMAGLFVLLSAEFLAAVQILVYAGGIMVLFLFTIMLVNIRRTGKEPYVNRQAGFAILMGLLLLTVVGGTVLGAARRQAGTEIAPADAAKLSTVVIRDREITGNSQAVSWGLYRDYLLPFEIASIFLLVAMVGAVVLGKRTMEKVD